jgi:peptidoglycan-N-acetylglucosamine deacetylase
VTNDPGDYANPGKALIARKLMSRLKPGAIILLHDGSEQMLDLLPAFFDSLKKQGYKICPLDEIKGGKGSPQARPAKSAIATR